MNFRKKFDKALEYLVVTIMSLLVVDVLWQVASRYILSNPSGFTDELAGFLLIWVGLIGSAYATGQRSHLAIDLLVQKLNANNRRKMDIVIQAAIAIFAISTLVIGGAWFVYTRFYLNQLSPALHIQTGYVYLVLPISGLIISYYSLDDMITAIRRDNSNDNKE